jgi:hypothetical protein
MFGKLKAVWRRWRESRRQYAIERALYKSGGGSNPTGRRGDIGARAGPDGGGVVGRDVGGD